MSNTTKQEYFNILTNSVLGYVQSIRKVKKSDSITLTISVPLGAKQLEDGDEREYARYDLTVYSNKEFYGSIVELLEKHPEVNDFKNKKKPSIYFRASDIRPEVFIGKTKDGKDYCTPSIKGRVFDVGAIYLPDADSPFYKKPSSETPQEEPEVQNAA